ncbi:MAG: rubrerythrin family protein [Chloroflexota bacterium]
MRQMTADNLKAAFAGESQAHMRYLIFADKAQREGRENVARLFRAIAYAEQVHATNHYRAMDGIKTTADNLDVAIGGETFEVDEMYPAYLEVARLQDERRAQTSMNYALETEKVHAKMYQAAKEAAIRGDDVEIGPISVCEICGYTIEGDLPERCPVCNAPRDKFKGFA